MLRTGDDRTVESEFHRPVLEALEVCDGRRDCPGLSDEDFLKSGVGRCVNVVRSGHDWIQYAAQIMGLPITVGRFFDSLKSDRRLNLLENVCDAVRWKADAEAPAQHDPFSEHDELEKVAIYAADGHLHGASVHETLVGEKRHAVGHFYSMNLRTQTMHHLDVARPKKKTEHDITALKRLEANALRMGEPTGRRVLLAYDPAVYDFGQWYKWKQTRGVYVITRKKANVQLLYCGYNDFDRSDPRNAGVVFDRVGAPNNSHMLREIRYLDPASGVEYIFLTNEMTMPPGLIAFIYKKRWDIEKVFDQFKTKMAERKAWGKSLNSKCAQAKFLVLTHNLTLMLERKLEREEGIVDEKIERKRKQRIEEDLKKIADAGRKENPLVTRTYKAVQRSFQFIRWLRNAIIVKTSWRSGIAGLRPLMARYLS